MGVGKSYLVMFLAAKASENWLLLYIADAAKLDLCLDKQSSEVIVRYFLAINKDILTAAELENLVQKIRTDSVVPFAEAMWDMLQQKNCKILVVVDKHGVLFSHKTTPAPLRLHILKPLMKLTYWGEDSLGTRVVLTGTAHAKFKKRYLINGMNDWVEFVGPLPEDIFDSLLKLHPIFGDEKIAPKDQLASSPQHSKFLVCNYECHPQFDFIIRYTFIQISVSFFDKHNQGSANILKAFEYYYKNGNDIRNQIEIYLDAVFSNQHMVMHSNGKFEVLTNGLPIESDFCIVYMRENPDSPNYTQLVKRYQDIAFISYDEIKTKLFGDFLRS
ncbi:hypothetical protein C1645_734870 [Glomus cerebriforme]|uniref:Uncharacterized protein n=1 Tax=Glomus cerebriforme TaxID=658196 RepID=A0A397THJ6_9GLOM|nr:hypothetical protein C1645_734870 [Glomus cerebriforme]